MSRKTARVRELIDQPDALLNTTHLMQLGLSERAAVSVMQACPLVVIEGHGREYVRVRDYLAYLDRQTVGGRRAG